MTATVQIQTVLYNNTIGEIWRFMQAIKPMVDHAHSDGVLQSARLVVGDCSNAPRLGDADLADLGHCVEGIELDYRFFGANLMFGRGHNTLAASATDDHLLVINPDTHAAPAMLSHLLRTAADPSIGIAEARQIPLEHPKSYDRWAGDTSWASGCCVLIRERVFRQVGGFDPENFPLYCEDVDLSWRVRLAGFRVVYVPKATIFHDKRISNGGAIVVSDTERYHSAFGGLMLARRYGRPDIQEQIAHWISRHGEEPQRRALAEFERRRKGGTAPDALPGAERVAEFVNGEYARHRF